MFRFYGGQVVKKGTYRNLSSGESIELEHEKIRAGNRQVRDLKVPTTGIFILGPISGLLSICLLPLISLLIGLMLLTRTAAASSEEAQMCLGCHSDKNLTKQLDNKEVLSLFINGNEFANSIHNAIGCAGCHMDISMENHPQIKKVKSKKEYSSDASKVCTMCHPDEQLRKKPIHSSLMTKATCVECHGSHSINRMAAQKIGLKENQYCLTCHRSKLSMTMRNRESLSAFVDESALRSSAHGNLQCSDCHSGFSKTGHPVKIFSSRRDYSIVTSDICRKCHTDAATKYEGSIHYSVLKGGDLKAPACTDCHGGHSVAKATKDKTLGLISCNKCHGEMKSSYETSIHYTARIKGVENAPVCSSCHNAHDVKVTAMTMKIKDACLKCHKDAEKIHKKWLSNPPFKLSSFAGLHFDAVACAACHSTDAGRGIYLGLYDRKTGKPLPEEDVLKLLETESPGLMEKMDINGDGSIDAREIWNLFKQLYKKGATTTFIGRMDVRKGAESHQIAGKAKAVRECEKCHRPDSEFFKDVFIVISKADGRPTLFDAKKEALNSFFSILPVSKFYALGSTNVKLLDILFIIAVLGGIAVPIGHVTLRIITSPLRSLRRMGKGGKK